MERQYLSVKEFAALSGFSVPTIHRMLSDGRLRHCQPGGKGHKILIPRDALEIEAGVGPSSAPTSPASPDGEAVPARRRSGPKPRWQSKFE